MNISKSLTAAASFYTVRKVRGGWGVLLVMPSAGKDLIIHIHTLQDRDTAIHHGKATAAQMPRPCALRGAVL